MHKGTRYRQTKALRIKQAILGYFVSNGVMTPTKAAEGLVRLGHISSLQMLYAYLRELVADGKLKKVDSKPARYEAVKDNVKI